MNLENFKERFVSLTDEFNNLIDDFEAQKTIKDRIEQYQDQCSHRKLDGASCIVGQFTSEQNGHPNAVLACQNCNKSWRVESAVLEASFCGSYFLGNFRNSRWLHEDKDFDTFFGKDIDLIRIDPELVEENERLKEEIRKLKEQK